MDTYREEEEHFFARNRRRLRERLKEPRSRFITIALMTAALLLIGGLVYWVILLFEIPDIRELRAARFEQATIVYTTDGEELTRYHDKNRTWIEFDQIAPEVVEALIATEDHRFYEHWGVDAQRMFGSVFRTIGGDPQGGSTITMQFARNAFPDIADDAVYTRKLKEMVTALRIESMFEKEEILEMYLNTVPFMYNAYGIEAAARTYFQKPASELDLLESATLVGMLKGTVLYNPVRNPERSHERRNTVLQQMVKRGYLQPDEYQEIKDEETQLNFRRLTHEDNLAPYFAEYLRQWLDEWAERRGYNLYSDGLRVYSTIRADYQAAATVAVEDVMEDLQAVVDVEWSRRSPPYFSSRMEDYQQFRKQVTPFAYYWETHPEVLQRSIRESERYRQLVEEGVSADEAASRLRSDAAFVDSIKTAYTRLQASFVALDPNNGHVVAWVGGTDFKADKFDRVAVAKRQPGSTFKPFVYAAALESGYGPDDVLRDEVIEYRDPQTRRVWRPTNVSAATGRMITLRDALAYSKNTITAQLVMDVGPQRVVDFAHRMGIQSELKPYPSIGLGTSEVSLLELAGAYTTIANSGVYQEPIFVTRIEDSHGYVLETFSSDAEEVLSEQTAYTLLDMMRGVVDYGTGIRIRNVFGLRGDVAAKTGTSQNGADGWFMLLHPQLITGSWVGFDIPSLSFRSNYWGQGAHNALYIAGNFVREVEVPTDVAFREPPGYVEPLSRRDTMRYASDDWYDSSYLDSLERRSEYAFDEDYTPPEVDWEWEPLEEQDEREQDAPADGITRSEDRSSTRTDAGGGEETTSQPRAEPPIEELSETDRLNRRERESSQVDDVLERLRNRRGEQ